MKLSDEAILDYIAVHPGSGRKEIRRHVARNAGETTIWRVLRRLVDEGRLEVSGKGPATGYLLAGAGVVRAHLQTPYNRRKPVGYNKEFLDRYVPGKDFYLPEAARRRLHKSGKPAGGPVPAGTYAHHILERLLVDFSWASSRMEGNTYSLLETERLIRFGEEAAGRDRKETIMILNHKEAIQYMVDNLGDITVSRRDVCNVHALLANGLLMDPAMAGRLRRMPAGIGHSSYRPLEDQYRIEEEFEVMIAKAAEIADPFEQSFFLLVHIPYLQAFDDINKRTSRIFSNVPLLKAGLAPMSFMPVSDRDYIDGLIGIYELNNAALLREVYIDAYRVSAENYRALRAEVETPEKAALTYRDFVRTVIRRAVLEWNEFRREETMMMAENAGIPKEDRGQVADYIAQEFEGLHEGNAIRYRLRPEDLVLNREKNS